MVSSLKSRLAAVAFVVAAGFAATPVLAQDANVHQIYEAVQAGRLKDAESMIERVVREHPNSAKAHYVAAEVYAREGKIGPARTELSKAEQIDPLLSFATPASVRTLRAELQTPATAGSTAGNTASRAASTAAPAPAPVPAPGFPWGALALGALVLGGAVWFARRRAANVAPAMPAAPSNAMSPMSPMSPAAPNYGAAPYPGAVQPAARSGLGSALATAAAVGVGVVAGEAIAHSLTRDDRHAGAAPADGNNVASHPDAATPLPAEHEPDFGVRDDGGWNDSGLSGGDFGVDAGGGDWN